MNKRNYEQDIVDWQQLHPSGTKTNCSTELGISFKTVTKYWKQPVTEDNGSSLSSPVFKTATKRENENKEVSNFFANRNLSLKPAAKINAHPEKAFLSENDNERSEDVQQMPSLATISTEQESLEDAEIKSEQSEKIEHDTENKQITTIDRHDNVSDPSVDEMTGDEEKQPELTAPLQEAAQSPLPAEQDVIPVSESVSETSTMKQRKRLFSRFEKKKNDREGKEDKKKVDVSAPLENPYIQAKNKYRDRFHSLAASNLAMKFSLMIIALFCLGLLALNIEISNRSHLVPYVLVTDRHGITVGTGEAHAIAPDDVENRFVIAQVSSFIRSMRTVTPDASILRINNQILQSCLKTEDPAFAKVAAWVNGEAPGTNGKTAFERSYKTIVHVDIESIRQLSDSAFNCEWVEIEKSRLSKDVISINTYRATISWYKAEPSSELMDLQYNPYGIYIKDYDVDLLEKGDN